MSDEASSITPNSQRIKKKNEVTFAQIQREMVVIQSVSIIFLSIPIKN